MASQASSLFSKGEPSFSRNLLESKTMKFTRVLLCSCVLVFLLIFDSTSGQRTRGEQLRFLQSQNNKLNLPRFAQDPGEPLLLTPFINNGSVRVARELCKVRDIAATESYSGFFVVHQNYKSNLFFWFFPSQHEAKTAKVVLWLGSGPGVTSLYGLFNKNGPFEVDAKNILKRKETPWTLTHSVIYMDSSVGSGFSYTEDINGYAKTSEEVSRDLYAALIQFFQLFPDFQSREFFVAGESYASKYVVALAYKIHQENQRSPFIAINLKGFLLGTPFIDPPKQLDYGNFFYNIGIIGEKERNFFRQLEKVTLDLVRKQRWTDAFKVGESLMMGYPLSAPSYYQNVTGFHYVRNYLQSQVPEERHYFINFLEQPHIRNQIHVGSLELSTLNDTVYYAMNQDVYQSVRPLLEVLLDAPEDYKVLIYAGQLDTVVPHTTIRKVVKELKWSGAQEFPLTERVIWRVNDEVAGYTKTVRNLVYLFMRNAGNIAGYDQPLWSFDMINRFTV